MRVLAVTPLYPPHSRVGAWLATHQLMRHLVERDHEVTAFAYMDRRLAWTIDGVRVESIIRGRDRAFELAARADVVISHCGDEGFGLEVAAVTGRPAVRMAHGGGPAGSPLMYGDASLVVFNSQALRDASEWRGPGIVVHPYTDPERYRASEIGDRVTLINLSEAKGGPLLWEIAGRLPGRQFLGVHGGYGQQDVRHRLNVKVLRNTPEMTSVYRRTRVLLMPSSYEAWGMVGVEAMASGIPVVASDLPGLRESLGDAGVFVDRGDVDGWVREVERLHDPVEWAEASERARERSAVLAADDGRDRFVDALDQVVGVVA